VPYAMKFKPFLFVCHTKYLEYSNVFKKTTAAI